MPSGLLSQAADFRQISGVTAARAANVSLPANGCFGLILPFRYRACRWPQSAHPFLFPLAPAEVG